MKKVLFSLITLVFLTGAALLRAENLVFPADAGVIDVTRPPYNAKGDGIHDATAAIQAAIDSTAPNVKGASVTQRKIIYLPRGIYRITRTLQWPLSNENRQVWGMVNLQGQETAKTILKLADGAFTDPGHPQALVNTGRAGSADRFHNSIRNLTLDTGCGNPGAIGLQFFSNNTGCARNLLIRSGDGKGVTGLDMTYNDMNGPLLIENVSVEGFAIGIHTGFTVNSQTFEHIRLIGQTRAGWVNDGQCVALRGLKFIGTVPAILNNSGVMTLIDADLHGAGARKGTAAITNGETLFARNITQQGYAVTLENHKGGASDVKKRVAEEWASSPPQTLFPQPEVHSLNLPVRETPDVGWDDPKGWANVRKFGTAGIGPAADIQYRGGDGQDDTRSIQAAIDSGATTVYLPHGSYTVSHPIVIRGKVKRILGCEANLASTGKGPIFRFAGGVSPVVVVERLGGGDGIFITHASNRTLVLRDCDVSEIDSEGSGDFFLEDVVAGPVKFLRAGQRIWARQLNVENPGTHILNQGATLWVLGLKTEQGGTLIDTESGGATELLGGLCYTTNRGKLAPMFLNNGGTVSLTIGECCYSGDPYTDLVSETQQGVTRTLKRAGLPGSERSGLLRPAYLGGSVLPLYVGAAPHL